MALLIALLCDTSSRPVKDPFLRVVQDGIRRVRLDWKKSDDRERLVRDAFAPLEMDYVLVALDWSVEDHLESDDNEEFGKFRGTSRLGGKKNVLTPEFRNHLWRRGMLFMESPERIVPRSCALMFALPENGEWVGYVVVRFKSCDLPARP